MNTPINSRDLALQATAIRVLGVSSNYISLSCPTQQFKYGTDNVAQPSSTIVTATLIGALKGTVTFSTTGISPAPTSTTNQLIINPDNITGDFATISATLTYQGETYIAVPISISKIFNQLVARITTPIDQVPAYSDGTGYTLPTADNFVELYNGVVKLASGVIYGPITQTKNGLTVAVNATTGKITLSQANPSAWTSATENFTLTATRNNIAYTATYTVTKAKQGYGGQQLADVVLYQWSTAQPAVPVGTSVYTWATKGHNYTNDDSWRTTVSANPGTVGIKLWRAIKGIIAPSEATTPTYSFTWAAGTAVRQVTTDANDTIKTRIAIVYKNDISAPTISGTSTYNWNTASIDTAPSGWSLVAADTQPGFTLYQAAVDLLAAQSETSSVIDWTRSSITPVRYAGGNGAASITADLTNATHAIPTDSTGSTINFANSGTDLFVYEGATPLVYDGIGTGTGKYKVTVTASGVTAGAVSTVTANGATGARFDILTGATFAVNTTGKLTFVVSGRRLTTEPGVTIGTPFTYTVEQTFTKTPGGVQGVAGVAYWLITSASVIQKNINNVFNPSTITISGKQSSGAAASNYSAWFRIFKNNDTVATYSSSVAEAFTTYTLEGASTSSIRVNMYSDSGFTNLLDQETIPVVSDGSTGQTGAAARRAYVVATTTPSGSPTSLEVVGDNLPTAGTWFAGKTYSTTAPAAALAAGESLYQSDGVYVSGGNTTWGFPYLSSLKVGNLQAISANTGDLTVTGSIKGGTASSLTAGNGFFVDSNGYLRVGNPNGAQLKFDAGGLSITNSAGTSVFTVVSSAETAAANAARSAEQAATNAGTAATNAGNSASAAATAAANATIIKVQYSADSVNWHDSFTTGDIYLRTGSKTAAAPDYTWGAASKFVGDKGDKGDQGGKGDKGDQGNPGGTGSRGSVTRFINTGLTYWNDDVANNYFNNTYGGKVLNDTLTEYGPSYSETKFWDGSSWIAVTVAINGNLLVSGTVGADKLTAGSVLIGHQIRNASNTFVIDFGANPYISISV
jgi:hypothetical protein